MNLHKLDIYDQMTPYEQTLLLTFFIVTQGHTDLLRVDPERMTIKDIKLLDQVQKDFYNWLSDKWTPHLPQSIGFFNRDEEVIGELKRRGQYDLLMGQAARVGDQPYTILEMKKDYPDALIYYRYFVNHPDPKDNGFQMVKLPPDASPDLQNIVEKVLEADHWTQGVELYRDDPERRN